MLLGHQQRQRPPSRRWGRLGVSDTQPRPWPQSCSRALARSVSPHTELVVARREPAGRPQRAPEGREAGRWASCGGGDRGREGTESRTTGAVGESVGEKRVQSGWRGVAGDKARSWLPGRGAWSLITKHQKSAYLPLPRFTGRDLGQLAPCRGLTGNHSASGVF